MYGFSKWDTFLFRANVKRHKILNFGSFLCLQLNFHDLGIFLYVLSAKWYWWLKGLIPRIQKIHRGQIDLASMYEKKSVEKNESISPKWTQMDWMDSSMQYIIKSFVLKSWDRNVKVSEVPDIHLGLDRYIFVPTGARFD